MSHHLDQENPQFDISDVYCFRGATGTVFVMNVSPMNYPASGFDREALYEFKIDTNGDDVEDVTWRVTFPIDGAGAQVLKLEQLTGNAARDRDAAGKVITPAGAKPEQIITCSNGIKLFAGERGDPFFNDPRLTLETKRALSTHTAPNYSWVVAADRLSACGLDVDQDHQDAQKPGGVHAQAPETPRLTSKITSKIDIGGERRGGRGTLSGVSTARSESHLWSWSSNLRVSRG